METNRIKPCPFCGSLPKFYCEDKLYILECENTRCERLVQTRKCKTPNRALEIWNSRFDDSGGEVNHND